MELPAFASSANSAVSSAALKLAQYQRSCYPELKGFFCTNLGGTLPGHPLPVPPGR